MFQRLTDKWRGLGTRSKIMIAVTIILVPLFVAAIIVIFGTFGGPLNILTAK